MEFFLIDIKKFLKTDIFSYFILLMLLSLFLYQYLTLSEPFFLEDIF
jgi:hypothetical protein